MSNNNTFTVKFRRRREGVTDYRARLRLLKSGKPRLVIRRSLKNISAQVIAYSGAGDKVIVSAHSKELEKFGWKANRGNIPAAYFVGLLAGKKAISKNVKEAVLDIGPAVSTKGSRIYAALKGAVDAGLDVPHNKEALPDEKRIKGEHISLYLKNNINPAETEKIFESVKAKIIG